METTFLMGYIQRMVQGSGLCQENKKLLSDFAPDNWPQDAQEKYKILRSILLNQPRRCSNFTSLLLVI